MENKVSLFVKPEDLSKLWAAQLPEEPRRSQNNQEYCIDCHNFCQCREQDELYERAHAKALSEALEVVNPEDFAYYLTSVTYGRDKAVNSLLAKGFIKVGEYYAWPGEVSMDIFNSKLKLI